MRRPSTVPRAQKKMGRHRAESVPSKNCRIGGLLVAVVVVVTVAVAVVMFLEVAVVAVVIMIPFVAVLETPVITVPVAGVIVTALVARSNPSRTGVGRPRPVTLMPAVMTA